MTNQIIAPTFGIVRARSQCPHCLASTPVSALMVFDFKSRANRDHEWGERPVAGLVSHVTKVSAGASRLWTAMSPCIRPAIFSQGGPFYYVNSCEHCNQPIGDLPLRKPGGVFNPLTKQDETQLSLIWLESTVIADARVQIDDWMDRLLTRFHPWA